MEVLVGMDRDASAAAMRDHVITSMQRAIERLEPYFRARKTQGKTYSRKQFTIELPGATAVSAEASPAEA
jgi:hypothetical protein